MSEIEFLRDIFATPDFEHNDATHSYMSQIINMNNKIEELEKQKHVIVREKIKLLDKVNAIKRLHEEKHKWLKEINPDRMYNETLHGKSYRVLVHEKYSALLVEAIIACYYHVEIKVPEFEAIKTCWYQDVYRVKDMIHNKQRTEIKTKNYCLLIVSKIK